MTPFKRGDIVLCADGRGDYTSKPRPVVIVQNSDYLDGLESVTICPITRVLSAASLRVRIKAGEENLSPFSEAETRHLGNVYFLTKERLSCQTRLHGDATVEAKILETRNTPLKRK